MATAISFSEWEERRQLQVRRRIHIALRRCGKGEPRRCPHSVAITHSSRDSPFSIASGEPVELAARSCTGFARMHLSAKSTSGWRTRHFLAQRKSSVVADSQLLFCLSPRYSAPHKGWPKGIQYRNAAAPGKQTGYCLGGVVIAAIVKPIHISVGVGIVLQALRAAAR